MKYFVWVFVFMTYLLMSIGLFLIITSYLDDFDFYEESVVFRFAYGLSSIFITLAGAFVTADFVGKSWDGANPDEPDKKKDRAKWGIFSVVFAALFVVFWFLDAILPLRFSVNLAGYRLSLFIQPFEVSEPISILSLPGLIFAALNIALVYVLIGIVNKRRLAVVAEADETAVPDENIEDKE